jgi:hypothetical protein
MLHKHGPIVGVKWPGPHECIRPPAALWSHDRKGDLARVAIPIVDIAAEFRALASRSRASGL